MTSSTTTNDARTRAADRLASALANAGVRFVFGMPGSHTTTLYDALGREGSIKTILIRNEQAAAFAADGFTRASGFPGVVCTTAGPGATNALTGVAEAWADSIPILLLSGQVNADRLHEECGAYHEIDLESILRPVTKYCTTVIDPNRVEEAFSLAWAALTSGRQRPAALVLPQDVMRMEASRGSGNMTAPKPFAEIDLDALGRAADLLNRSERPIVLAGGGALWSGCSEESREIARRLKAPLVTSLNAKGLIDERDPVSLGHARSARAKVALPLADAMLAVGCRFTELMTHWRTMPVPEHLVQIDIDPAQVGMNHPVQVGIVADARFALKALLPMIEERAEGGWGETWERAKVTRPERPEWLIEALRAEMPDDAAVFTDACEIGYRFQTDWTSTGPRRLFYPSNYITLGWAFPAALGASVALGPRIPVVSVSGDGGFVMTSQELATAARYRLHVIAIVHNDSTYGAIKNIQERDQGGRFLDVDLNNPDFLKLAEAYGVHGCRAADPATFARALRDALERGGPSLIEVPDAWRKIRN